MQCNYCGQRDLTPGLPAGQLFFIGEVLCKRFSYITTSARKFRSNHILLVRICASSRWHTMFSLWAQLMRCGRCLQKQVTPLVWWQIVSDLGRLSRNECNIFCDKVKFYIELHGAYPMFFFIYNALPMQTVKEVSLAFITLPAMYEMDQSYASEQSTVLGFYTISKIRGWFPFSGYNQWLATTGDNLEV